MEIVNLGAKLAKKQYPVTPYTMAQWQMYLPTLYEKGIAKEVEVIPALANKYRFDLAGLLANEFNVGYDLIMPTIFVNGYNTSTDYNGDRFKLFILDSDFCSQYSSAIYNHS